MKKSAAFHRVFLVLAFLNWSIAAVAQTLPAPNVSGLKYKGTSLLDAAGTVTPALPLFPGPCGTATAGTAAFNCNGLLAASNTWSGTNTFAGLNVTTVSTPTSCMKATGNAAGQKQWCWYIGGTGNYFLRSLADDGTTLGTWLIVNPATGAMTFTTPPILPVPPVNQNDNTANTTANSQNRLSRVATIAAVAGWGNTAFPVEVDGTMAAGDGGSRKMTFDSANLCGAGGHPAADIGTCINSTVVTTGSWNIDWASVGQEASPALFEGNPSADSTAAIQKAANTGKTVTYCARAQWNISSDITRKTANQIFHSCGRDGTYIVGTAPGGFTKGLFVDTASGIVDRDYSTYVVQPTSPANLAALNQYPPTYYKQNATSWLFQRVGCYQNIYCVDMRGNAGQAHFDDFAFNAYSTGIQIDGTADTVYMHALHWYPFLMSTAQQSVFNTNATGISSGRMDDFELSGGTFFGGQALNFFQGSTGPTFGHIVNVDFDNFSGIKISAGTMSCASCTFTGGLGSSQLIYATGGQLDVTASNFGSSVATPAFISLPSGSTAAVSVTGSTLNSLGFDVNQASLAGGTLVLTGNKFLRTANVGYNQHTISTTGGRLIAVGNYASDRGTGGGTGLAVNIATDGINRVEANAFVGWGVMVAGTANPNSHTPTSAGGVYAGN